MPCKDIESRRAYDRERAARPEVREKERLRSKRRAVSEKLVISVRGAEYREKNKERLKETAKFQRAARTDQIKEYDKAYRAANREKRNAYNDKWRAENEERYRAAVLARNRANAGEVNARTARRAAAKKQAVPQWANLAEIDEIYKAARWLSENSGEVWEVDHIVPLQSKTVCGLHCEANLDVVLRKDNRSKCNRRWPDMW